MRNAILWTGRELVEFGLLGKEVRYRFAAHSFLFFLMLLFCTRLCRRSKTDVHYLLFFELSGELFDNTAGFQILVVMVIVTPRLVASEWCREEEPYRQILPRYSFGSLCRSSSQY
jgi:hypothetical protein